MIKLENLSYSQTFPLSNPLFNKVKERDKHPLLDIPNRYNSISNITNQSNMIQNFCSIKRNEVTMIDLYKNVIYVLENVQQIGSKLQDIVKTDKVIDFPVKKSKLI